MLSFGPPSTDGYTYQGSLDVSGGGENASAAYNDDELAGLVVYTVTGLLDASSVTLDGKAISPATTIPS
eukprot:scaffold527147_cov22-Prasinocladus_malaysianus.AAC.1